MVWRIRDPARRPAGRSERDRARRPYSRHRALDEAGDWTGLAALFADDASCLDSVYGWSHGHDAIAAFLTYSMRGLEDWHLRIHSVAVDASTSGS